MSLVINTNISSLQAQQNLVSSGNSLSKSVEQLSSGLQINSAADNAAGLAIATRFSAQINGDNQAVNNANDAVSLAQTAEGTLTSITNNLQTIRQLAVQSANGTNSASDRAALDTEAQQLVQEIDREAKAANFNGVQLLDGSNPSFTFQVGANTTVNDKITVSGLTNSTANALGNYTPQVVTGLAPTAPAAIAAGSIQINGVDIGAVASGGTAAGQGANVAAAINNISAETGVTASVNSGTGAISLSSVNAISVTSSLSAATTSAETGLVLNSATSSTGSLTGAGATTQSALAAGDISINGTAIGAVAAGTGTQAAYEQSIATAITDANISGVSASVSNGNLVISSSGNLTVTSSSGELPTFATDTGLTLNGAASTAGTATTNGLNGLSLSTAASSQTAITQVDNALSQINVTQATLGAVQNRFASVVSSLQTSSTNLTSARSGLEDTDYAQATAAYTQASILQQAGTSVLAQANSIPKNVLSLLQNL